MFLFKAINITVIHFEVLRKLLMFKMDTAYYVITHQTYLYFMDFPMNLSQR
jgi:hypothetical protein